ncbi:MAG: ATP-dependent Clp protease ATP-binding subunit, partial [Chlamydiia bacterium]|nr:ATP-dependent Clp protease ATP-binding subunit [Chlamydiia bacterium]
FRNTIILMTSNLGSDLIRRSTEVGFGVQEGMLDYDTMKEKIDKAAKKHFKPEFVNRLDDTVIFKALDKDSLVAIIDLEVDKLMKRLERKNIYVQIEKAAKELLVEKGYQPEMGARTLRRTIEQELEDPLAEKLLLEGDEPRQIVISAKEGKITFKDEGLPKEKKKKEKKKLASATLTKEETEEEPSP